MLGRIDYSGFYKFLASIGLTLMAVSIIVPWLFIRTETVLSIPETKVRELTDISRDAILQRQEMVAGALPWVIGVCGALLITGVIFLWIGLFQWKERQKLNDESENLDLRQKRAQIEEVPEEEVTEIKNQEAREEVPDSSINTHTVTSDTETTQTKTVTSARQDFINITRAAEEHGMSLLDQAFGSDFEISKDARTTRARFMVDAVLTPSKATRFGQVGIDFRVISASSPISYTGIQRLTHTAVATVDLSMGNVYTGRAGRPAKAETTGIAIFLLRESDEASRRNRRSIEQLAAATDSLNSVLRRPVSAVAMPLAYFETLTPDSFQEIINTAWQKSGFTSYGNLHR